MALDDELSPEDEQRRRHLVQLLSVSAMTMTPLSALQAAWWGSEPEKLPDDKSIFSLDGDVRVNNARANESTRIRAGDIVRTGRDSEVIFVVGSDSFIMRSNSQMQIEGGGFFVNALRLLTGSVLSVFGKRATNEQLSMNSSTATIGIRGTGVYMEAERDLTYFCTCYGQVELASSLDPNEREIITAEHHDAPKYISNRTNGKSYIQPAPFINHTDTELKLLEAIVGREVPFDMEIDIYEGERRDY